MGLRSGHAWTLLAVLLNLKEAIPDITNELVTINGKHINAT
jgi:hypothetical protein